MAIYIWCMKVFEKNKRKINLYNVQLRNDAEKYSPV